MEFKKTKNVSEAIKLEALENGKVVGRAFLYFIKNDLHDRPYALFEDLFVQEESRRRGVAGELFKEAVKEAEKNNCYKLLTQSRYEKPYMHEFYKRNGMKDYGKNFRMDFK